LEVGLLQLGVQSFDRRRTDLYSEAHGRILLFRDDRNVYGEIHPFAHGHQFCISNSFSEDLYYRQGTSGRYIWSSRPSWSKLLLWCSARANAMKPANCSLRSTTGSPRALTPPICKRRRPCWRSWLD